VLELSLAVSNAEIALGLDPREAIDVRMRLADRMGDQGELAESLAVLSLHYSTTGAFVVGRIFLEASARHAREHQLPVALARALVNLAAFAQSADLVEAAEFAQESLDAGTRAGISNLLATAQANLVLVLSASGRWNELDTALSRADALRRYTFSDIGYVAQTLAALDRGLVPPSSDIRGERSSEAPADHSWYLLGDAADALVARDNEAAFGHAVESARVMHALAGTYDDFVHSFGLVVDLAADVADRERLTELLELVDGAPAPLAVQAHHARLRALVARSDGTPADEVEKQFRRAIDLYEQWGSPPAGARTQCELGLWLRDQGRVEEGEELLARARATYRELGAAGRLEALDGARTLT